MKENRTVSPIHDKLQVGDWVWVSQRKEGPSELHYPVTGPARVLFQGAAITLVEFPDANEKLHDGHSIFPKGEGRDKHCWYVFTQDCHPLPMDFCVFTNGLRGTTYCLRGDKRNVAGKAQFAGGDGEEFDPRVGAVIAIARAYGVDPTKLAFKVLEALSALPGDDNSVRDRHIRELFDRVTKLEKDLDRTKDTLAVALAAKKIGAPIPVREVKQQQPMDPPTTRKVIHVEDDEESWGVVGEPTNFVDYNGVQLRVGDEVRVTSRTCSAITDVPSLVVQTEEDGAFVMGLCSQCHPDTGEIDGKWKVVKTGKTIVDEFRYAGLVFTVEEEKA